MNKEEYVAFLLAKYKESLLLADYQAYEEAKKLPEDFIYSAPEVQEEPEQVREKRNPHKRR